MLPGAGVVTTLADIQSRVGVTPDGRWGPVTASAIMRALGSDAPLVPSSRCADLIKSYERCRLSAYLPTPHDVPTIGWGSTGADVKLGMTWTQAQADARFAHDLDAFGEGVAAAIGSAPTKQPMYDSLTSLAYNIGLQAFKDSTLLRLHKEGDYEGAARQFRRWNRQKGVVLAGLTRRRASEEAMYRSGIQT